MSDLSYPAYPILAILASVLVIVPLPWHLQSWNMGTCLYMFWTSLACLNLGINSIVWRHDAINRASVWCDISSRIIVASAVAIPCASLCIIRRLYKIAAVQTVGVHRKTREIAIDLGIGLGIPILQLVMQYIVSGHRFDIFEQVGCYPFTYNTPVAYPLSIVWPLTIGVVSAVYCFLTLHAFFMRRTQFAQFLTANPTLTANRYLRLMGLASVEILFTIPIATYGMVLNITLYPIQPWISWADTHFNYSQVNLYPAVVWRISRIAVISIELSRALPLLCAFVFFLFFGFAEEARRNYKKGWNRTTSLFKRCLRFKRNSVSERRIHSSPLASSPSSFARSKFDAIDFSMELPSYEDCLTPSSSRPFAKSMASDDMWPSSSIILPSPSSDGYIHRGLPV